MNIELRRFSDNGESTLGLLFVNKKFECYTIEDTHRDVKVSGETRIPAGYYKIRLRNEGTMTKRYAKKFPLEHRGMLWLQNVENFEWVYIHIGNTAKNSRGCILVANTVNNNQITNGFAGQSTDAYESLYRRVVAEIAAGEQVFIRVRDEDR